MMEGKVKVEYSAVFTREENGLYSVEFPNPPSCVVTVNFSSPCRRSV